MTVSVNPLYVDSGYWSGDYVPTSSISQVQTVSGTADNSLHSTLTTKQAQSMSGHATMTLHATATTKQAQTASGHILPTQTIGSTSQLQNASGHVKLSQISNETSSQVQKIIGAGSLKAFANTSSSQMQTMSGHIALLLRVTEHTMQVQTSSGHLNLSQTSVSATAQLQETTAAGVASGSYQFQHSFARATVTTDELPHRYYNRIEYSEQIDHPVWENAVYGTWTLASVSANQIFAPDNVQTADVLTLGPGPSGRVQQVSIDPGAQYTFSIFVHAGTADITGMKVVIAEGLEGSLLRFNSATVQMTADEYFDGWVRVYRTFTVSPDADSIEVGVGSDIDQEGKTFTMWGAQIVRGAVAMTYEKVPMDVVTDTTTPPSPLPVPEDIPEPPFPIPPLPALDDPFNEYYTIYSAYYKDVVIPDHFAVYEPDNQISGQCISVITPEPDLGARVWTHQGKWITIGIFRDEGREPAMKPESTSLKYWVRSGSKMVITDAKKHQLVVGEKVMVFGTNVGEFESAVQKVINDYTFIIGCLEVGSITGNTGTYQGMRTVDFESEQVVFRLLPSYKLVPWEWVKNLFQASSPSLTLTKRTLFEITRGATIRVPNVITKNVNFKVPNAPFSETSFALRKRYNQRYDESGEPLVANYDPLGELLPPQFVDSKYKNNPYLYNNTFDGAPQNYRVFVYDFYGVDLNDIRRGPYYACNLISRDPRAAGEIGNFKRKTDEFGTVLYSGPLFDEFGNVAVGIQENNALITQQNVLPLTLDSFNHPVKDPLLKRVL